MPELIKLYIRHTAIGFGIAAVFVALLLWFNIMGLWHHVSHSGVGVLAVFMLWFMNGIVFAGVQFAWAVMNLAETDKDDDRNGNLPLIQEYHPIPVRVDETSNQMRRQRR